MATDKPDSPNCFKPDPNDLARAKYVSELVDYARTRFTEIDSNKDNFLSSNELDAALKTATTDKDKEMLGKLVKNRSSIAKLSDDEWFWEASISKPDLDRLDSYAKWMPMEVAKSVAAQKAGRENFDFLTEGGDRVHHDELKDKLQHLPVDMPECTREAIKVLGEQWNDVHHVHAKVGSIKMDDFDDYPSRVRYDYEVIYDINEK